MPMLRRHWPGFAFGVFTLFGSPALSQPAAPVTVTPPTLRPQHSDNGFDLGIPQAGGLAAPAGSERLSVSLGGAELEGGFPEVADQSEAVMAKLRGRRVTLAQIYAAASEIEAIHARAGYVLARAAVPPQTLRDGDVLRIVIIDGFVESVDVSRVPPRVRAAVAARAAALKGRRHIKLAEIEMPLLLANDVPGLSLKSTLARGDQPGGTKIVLEGVYHLVSGVIEADNQLDPSLGAYGVNLQLSLNSLLGLGEQIYGFVSSGYDVSRIFEGGGRERVLGGGVVLPIRNGQFTLNPEATFSKTQPRLGQGAPPTVGDLARLTFRADYTFLETRRNKIAFDSAIEQIDEDDKAPSFGVTINHDRYMAARLGGSYDGVDPSGKTYGLSAQLSQGLGGLGSISLTDAARSGVPFSRQGADTDFTKLAVLAHGHFPLGDTIEVNLFAKSQTSFGRPVFRAEQFSMEGADGASAYVGGVTAVDEGVVLRAEVGRRWAFGLGGDALDLAPYLFTAFGAGRIDQPTAVEPSGFEVGVFGVGARANLRRSGLSFTLEYAHGSSDFAGLDKVDRVNFVTSLRL